MHRPDGADTVNIKPASTAPGPNPDSHFEENSVLEPEYMNMLKEELCVVVEASGQTLNKADDTQFLKALDLLGLEPAQFRARESAVPDMNVVVAAGRLQFGVNTVSKNSQTLAFVAPGADSRIDRIVIDVVDGTASIIQGVADPAPTAPNLTGGKIAVAQVVLTSGTTEIINVLITEERVFNYLPAGPVLLEEKIANNSNEVEFINLADYSQFDYLTMEFKDVGLNSGLGSGTLAVIFGQNGNYTTTNADGFRIHEDTTGVTHTLITASIQTTISGFQDVVSPFRTSLYGSCRLSGMNILNPVYFNAEFEVVSNNTTKEKTLLESFDPIDDRANNIKFVNSSGDSIEQGTFKLYGHMS